MCSGTYYYKVQEGGNNYNQFIHKWVTKGNCILEMTYIFLSMVNMVLVVVCAFY